MQEAWALNLKQLADASGVAFFFKQWGVWGPNGSRSSKRKNGHLLGGVEYHNYPTPILIYYIINPWWFAAASQGPPTQYY